MATLSLYKSGTIFRTRPISNKSGEPVLKSRYALPKTVYDLVIENVLWRDFIQVRMLGTTSELYVTLETLHQQFNFPLQEKCKYYSKAYALHGGGQTRAVYRQSIEPSSIVW